MKRFLLALFVPIFIVTLLNAPVIWSLAKAEFTRPARASEQPLPKAEEQADNSVVIPVLGLFAPVVGSPADPTEVSDWGTLKKDLTGGISLAEKLALPGEGGTTVLLGHSSDMSPNRYGAIFAGLNELQSGDQLSLKFRGQTYHYKVTDKKIVTPTDPLFATFKDKNQPHRLALVTCWPLLSTAKRLVVLLDPI